MKIENNITGLYVLFRKTPIWIQKKLHLRFWQPYYLLTQSIRWVRFCFGSNLWYLLKLNLTNYVFYSSLMSNFERPALLTIWKTLKNKLTTKTLKAKLQEKTLKILKNFKGKKKYYNKVINKVKTNITTKKIKPSKLLYKSIPNALFSDIKKSSRADWGLAFWQLRYKKVLNTKKTKYKTKYTRWAKNHTKTYIKLWLKKFKTIKKNKKLLLAKKKSIKFTKSFKTLWTKLFKKNTIKTPLNLNNNLSLQTYVSHSFIGNILSNFYKKAFPISTPYRVTKPRAIGIKLGYKHNKYIRVKILKKILPLIQRIHTTKILFRKLHNMSLPLKFTKNKFTDINKLIKLTRTKSKRARNIQRYVFASYAFLNTTRPALKRTRPIFQTMYKKTRRLSLRRRRSTSYTLKTLYPKYKMKPLKRTFKTKLLKFRLKAMLFKFLGTRPNYRNLGQTKRWKSYNLFFDTTVSFLQEYRKQKIKQNAQARRDYRQAGFVRHKTLQAKPVFGSYNRLRFKQTLLYTRYKRHLLKKKWHVTSWRRLKRRSFARRAIRKSRLKRTRYLKNKVSITHRLNMKKSIKEKYLDRCLLKKHIKPWMKIRMNRFIQKKLYRKKQKKLNKITLLYKNSNVNTRITTPLWEYIRQARTSKRFKTRARWKRGKRFSYFGQLRRRRHRRHRNRSSKLKLQSRRSKNYYTELNKFWCLKTLQKQYMLKVNKWIKDYHFKKYQNYYIQKIKYITRRYWFFKKFIKRKKQKKIKTFFKHYLVRQLYKRFKLIKAKKPLSKNVQQYQKKTLQNITKLQNFKRHQFTQLYSTSTYGRFSKLFKFSKNRNLLYLYYINYKFSKFLKNTKTKEMLLKGALRVFFPYAHNFKQVNFKKLLQVKSKSIIKQKLIRKVETRKEGTKSKLFPKLSILKKGKRSKSKKKVSFKVKFKQLIKKSHFFKKFIHYFRYSMKLSINKPKLFFYFWWYCNNRKYMFETLKLTHFFKNTHQLRLSRTKRNKKNWCKMYYKLLTRNYFSLLLCLKWLKKDSTNMLKKQKQLQHIKKLNNTLYQTFLNKINKTTSMTNSLNWSLSLKYANQKKTSINKTWKKRFRKKRFLKKRLFRKHLLSFLKKRLETKKKLLKRFVIKNLKANVFIKPNVVSPLMPKIFFKKYFNLVIGQIQNNLYAYASKLLSHCFTLKTIDYVESHSHVKIKKIALKTKKLFLKSLHRIPLILSHCGFLFTKRSMMYGFFKSFKVSTKMKLLKFKYSFFYKNDLKRMLLKYSKRFGLPTKLIHSKKFLKTSRFSLRWLRLHKNDFFSNISEFKTQTLAAYYQKLDRKLWSPIKSNLPITKPLNLRVKIKRIRFKPGYSRIWRLAREALNYTLKTNFRYQHRLTTRIHHIKRMYETSSIFFFDMILGRFLVNARFVFDYITSLDAIQSGIVFVNGVLSSSPLLPLFAGDLIQLVISIKYYITSRWLFNWTRYNRLRMSRLLYFRRNKSKYDLSKQKSSRLPDWIFNAGFKKRDIPKYTEVDYLTLSAFIIYEPYSLTAVNSISYLENRSDILPMYNWKYIN